MRRETPREKVERLLATVPRPFVVKIEGIWTVADGVYLYPFKPPFPIRCIYNGRFYFVSDCKHYFDFFSYDESSIENFVIQKNINSFPKPKDLVESQSRFRIYTYRRNPPEVVPAEPIPDAGEQLTPTQLTINNMGRTVREFSAVLDNTATVNIPQPDPIVNPQDPPPPVTPATGIVERITPAEFDPTPYIPFMTTPDLPTPNTH